MPIKGLVCLALMVLSVNLAQAEVLTVKIPQRAQSELDANYQEKLLELALQKSGQRYEIERVPVTLTQRTVELKLTEGREINLYWMGTSPRLEGSLIPVPVPLFRGLEGVRVAFIHKKNLATFAQFKTAKDLAPFISVQGVGWSDNLILERAGLTSLASRVNNILRLVNDGVEVDYFLRGIVEMTAEAPEALKKYPNVRVEPTWVLRYPFAQFFFVSPKEPELAAALHRGLVRAYKDGSFLDFFNQHPLIRQAKQELRLHQRRTLHIPNANMTPLLENVPTEYWDLPPSAQ